MQRPSHRPHGLTVLTDDFTGQLSLASLLLQGSVDARLDNFEPAGDDVTIVNTRTRDLDQQRAVERLAATMGRIKLTPGMCWAKRIDSMLYGPIGAELEQLIRLTGAIGGVLAPAHPLAGRQSRDGQHFVGDRWVGDLRAILPTVTSIQRVVTASDISAQPGTWWIPDVTCQEDLTRIASMIPRRPDFLVVDSGALTAALCGSATGAITPTRSQPTTSRSGRHVVVVQGSTTDLVAQQLAYLREAGLDNLTIFHSRIAGPSDPNLSILARVAAKRTSQPDVCAVVVGGGLTAEAFLDAACIPARSLVPMASPGPLLGLAQVIGGWHDGLLVATKSGQVGDQAALHELVNVVRNFSPLSPRQIPDVSQSRKPRTERQGRDELVPGHLEPA